MPRRVALLLLAACLAPAAGEVRAAPEAKVIFDYADQGYANLDPARARARGSDQRLVLALFECLTRLDPATGKPLPAAAERWEPAADGRSWTFTLRADGAWTDGKPVVAQDFVRGWRRVLDPDPDEGSPWRPLMRPLRGAGIVLDNDFARRVLDAFQRGLGDELVRKKDGIPGGVLRDLVEEVGLKAVPGIAEQPALRKMLRWGNDKFAPEQVKEVVEAIKVERKKRKTPTFETYDAFGVSLGALAKDDRTLVVETEGWVPYLPELLARSAFAPFPEAMVEFKDIGENTTTFVGNGPFKLFRRGTKPRGERVTPSTAHLVKNPNYKGPSPAKVDEVRCWTDEGVPEEMRRFKLKELQWLAAPDSEAQKDLVALPGYRTRPAGSVVTLRFRCDVAPFDKADARRAFAAHVDRTALAKLLWPAADVADRLVPPRVKGLAPGVRAPALDAGASKKLLEASGLDAAKLEKALEGQSLVYAEGLDALAGRIAGVWEKTLGVSGHLFFTEPELVKWVRAGRFRYCLAATPGAFDDPAAFLEPFAPSSPDGGLGWKDEAFEAFLVGARDVDAAAQQPDRLVGFAKNPETKARLAALKSAASATARDAVRQALLAEAEQRLLDEAVVIPICFPRVADVQGAVQGLGDEAAWSSPGFVGSLRDVAR